MNHPDTLHLRDDLMLPEIRERMRTHSRERTSSGMKIGIVGGGTVGHATARMMMEHAEVRVYDVIPERATHSLADTLDTSICFICLPTPQKTDSLECDLTAVERFFGEQCGSRANFVLRSTVPVGTTARLWQVYDLPNLCHSPEFLTARCAVTDAQIPARNIIGGAIGPVASSCEEMLAELYRKRFPGVPVLRMTSDESELVKLALNGFFATKIAYWNEVYTLAEHFRLNWERVMEGVLSDGRVAHSHTKVPGPDGKFGYGGECLVKDLADLISCLEKAGLPNPLTTAAYQRNEQHDRLREVRPR